MYIPNLNNLGTDEEPFETEDTYIHTYIHTYIQTDTHMRERENLCVYIYIYAHIHTCVHTESKQSSNGRGAI